jgi:hypothetical protein
MDIHLRAVRVAQAHDRAASRPVERLDGRAVRGSKRFKINRRWQGKPEAQEPRIFAARYPVDERCRPRAPQE